jgi:hypothetical protein
MTSESVPGPFSAARNTECFQWRALQNGSTSLVDAAVHYCRHICIVATFIAAPPLGQK